ncbi:MAG: response regulator [Pseudomonadota bacterium]|nr:response regulator [Pseudomonadota bacterium]
MTNLGEADITAGDLLLVDDDLVFCKVLSEALTTRGFTVSIAHDAEAAVKVARLSAPAYAVVDLVMPGRSGLELVAELTGWRTEMKIVVLTGYASIATAVESIKLGAVHYLTKPTDAEEIVAAFGRNRANLGASVSVQPVSVQRLQWEHLQKVLHDCSGNISETARRLSLHRRSLQRKLSRGPSE